MRKESELEATVFVAAFGAFTDIRTSGCPIEVLAADAAKRGFLASVLEESIVPTVIKQPQAEKNRGNNEAENDGGGNKIHPGKRCLGSSSRANGSSELKAILTPPKKYRRKVAMR